MVNNSIANPEFPSTRHGWSNHPYRPSMIEDLIKGVERYDPTQVQVLEDYLNKQFNEVFYDPMANLATLKLYQFNPDLVPLAAENPSNPIEAIHDSITVKILLLSIAHRPFDSDFSLGMSMCGDRMSSLVTPQATLTLVRQLSQLSTTIQSRRFAKFWSLLRSPDFKPLLPVVSSIVEFDNLIRESIAKSVASCFKIIASSRLQSFMGFQDEEQVERWVQQYGWRVDNGSVYIPANSDNCPVTSVTKENTALDDLQYMIGRSVIS